MRLRFSCLLFLALGVGNIAAQDAPKSADDSRDATLRQLMARVEALEAEVRQLRAEKSHRETDNGKATVSQPDKSHSLDKEILTPEPIEVQESFPQLKLRGFGDIDYHLADRGADKNAFRLGQLDLFITSRLAEDVSVLDENVIEANEENEFGFEIERLLLQWTPRDYFNVAVGRYHTAIGYYNNAYHHGKWLQTAVGRPTIFNFEDEGGLLPIHNVGISVSGAIPSGQLGLHYIAEIGNGRNYTPGQEAVQNVSDNNSFKALNLAIFARPDRFPGFQVGASVYFDEVNVRTLPQVDQTIVSAHAVYVSPMFEWLNEGVLIHDSSDLGSFDTTSFYTQIARQFGNFRPYARYQLLDINKHDPIMQLTTSPGFQQILSLGVRYNFTQLAAIKLQGDHTFDAPEGAPENELTLQMAFTF